MAYEESVEQLKSLIEHFNNGGNDFNATDIEAIKYLLKENKELKKQHEDMTLCRDIASSHREVVQDRETKLLNQQKSL